MTMKWRARSTLIGIYAAIIATVIAVGPSALSRPLGPVGLAIGLAGVAAVWGLFLATSSIWFRCPHCHARQLTGRWDWLLIGDRCRECNQPLDGPALSQEALDAEVEKELAAIDPQRLARWEQEAAARDALKAHLWQEAPTSAKAAKKLRVLLREDLKLFGMMRERALSAGAPESQAQGKLNQDEQNTRADLGKLEGILQSFGA